MLTFFSMRTGIVDMLKKNRSITRIVNRYAANCRIRNKRCNM